MNEMFLTSDHIAKFNNVVGSYMSKGFDLGFEHLVGIVGIGVLLIILKMLISKL